MESAQQKTEEFIILDESYLNEMAELYKTAFAGDHGMMTGVTENNYIVI